MKTGVIREGTGRGPAPREASQPSGLQSFQLECRASTKSGKWRQAPQARLLYSRAQSLRLYPGGGALRALEAQPSAGPKAPWLMSGGSGSYCKRLLQVVGRHLVISLFGSRDTYPAFHGSMCTQISRRPFLVEKTLFCSQQTHSDFLVHCGLKSFCKFLPHTLLSANTVFPASVIFLHRRPFHQLSLSHTWGLAGNSALPFGGRFGGWESGNRAIGKAPSLC